jgi:hypothetical protein
MTAPRDPDRLIETFLEDGVDHLPDWAFDEVRHDIHRTRQRVAIGPWREPIMSNLARYGVIAAAVVLLVGAGVFLSRQEPAGVAAPTATERPSPTEAAVASPTLAPDGVPPGPVTITDAFATSGPDLTMTIPEGVSGWTANEEAIAKDYGAAGDEDGPLIFTWRGGITGTYVDPCFDHTLEQPNPEGVEDLIAAIGNQRGISSQPAVDVTVSGYSGQYVDTTVTQDISKCLNGQDGFWLWDGKNSDRRYVQGTGELNRIYAFDVDGQRFTFAVRLPADTTDADTADVMAMLETLEITPVAPSPSP